MTRTVNDEAKFSTNVKRDSTKVNEVTETRDNLFNMLVNHGKIELNPLPKTEYPAISKLQP